jgi:hypothetical protein
VPHVKAVTCSNHCDQRALNRAKRSTGLSYRVPLALIVVLLAILGAFLHPLVWLLDLFSFTAPLVPGSAALRETIANLLGGGVLALLAVMADAGRRDAATATKQATGAWVPR